jgi:hypothetical protein
MIHIRYKFRIIAFSELEYCFWKQDQNNNVDTWSLYIRGIGTNIQLDFTNELDFMRMFEYISDKLKAGIRLIVIPEDMTVNTLYE